MTTAPTAAVQQAGGHDHERYKWVALTNTTLGMLMATINGSIVLISLPAIFRGVHLDPLQPSNSSYLLWMLMGYLLVSAVLVVTLGRLGDIYGRVRMYNAGFAVFALASVLLAVDPLLGASGALWLIGWRVLQGIGGAMLMANSTAIITDAWRVEQRGFALGINMVAGIAGSFIGLIMGGLLSEVAWRSVFFVSVPFGVLGTIWAYKSLREVGTRTHARIDWWGNITLAVGLIAILAAITYGIEPYGGRDMGWLDPWVLAGLIGGTAMLVVFVVVESRVTDPMFDLRLFRNRAFAAGNAAQWLNAIARGGLQFMLIIWLQGIWLPLHGYNYVDTPLWAGIYLLPLTTGFLVAGPVSGWLSDRFGARAFATGGLVVVAAAFGGLLLLPTDFAFWQFAVLIAASGLGSGLFAAPNAAAIMNSVPATQRGAANGMRATFQNSGMVLSIGLFFSLMIVGLASSLPSSLYAGLTAQGVPSHAAHQVANLPPVGSLFAAFLGYNPIQSLLGPSGVLQHLSSAQVHVLTGKEFFPHLMSGPFHHGLVVVFTMAIIMSLIGAAASLARGAKYVHGQDAPVETGAATLPGAPPVGAAPAAPAGPAPAYDGGARTSRGAERR
ncbi:MAG TPA: MFS transporter [Mycobacteriales bacterium]|jgi:MFS family permease|nr:MFS transporter [Mycobacteriales bacterium]